MISTKQLNQIKSNGFCIIRNFLDKKDFFLVENILKNYKFSKFDSRNKFSISKKSFFIKFLKLQFKKIYHSILLNSISLKYDFNKISENVFQEKTYLHNIDTYYNSISNKPVLDWHCDLSSKYTIKKNKILNPKMSSLKFFFYLTDTQSNNGCLSYIPKSHIVVKELGRLIFDKEIKYRNFWSLKNLYKIVKDTKIKKILIKKIGKKYLQDFLKNSKLVLFSKKKNIFDLPAKKGNLIIFDEFGVHRGSKINLTPRQVLRFFYRRKEISERFRYN